MFSKTIIIKLMDQSEVSALLTGSVKAFSYYCGNVTFLPMFLLEQMGEEPIYGVGDSSNVTAVAHVNTKIY